MKALRYRPLSRVKETRSGVKAKNTALDDVADVAVFAYVRPCYTDLVKEVSVTS